MNLNEKEKDIKQLFDIVQNDTINLSSSLRQATTMLSFIDDKKISLPPETINDIYDKLKTLLKSTGEERLIIDTIIQALTELIVQKKEPTSDS
jgi:hypothetical protein